MPTTAPPPPAPLSTPGEATPDPPAAPPAGAARPPTSESSTPPAPDPAAVLDHAASAAREAYERHRAHRAAGPLPLPWELNATNTPPTTVGVPEGPQKHEPPRQTSDLGERLGTTLGLALDLVNASLVIAANALGGSTDRHDPGDRARGCDRGGHGGCSCGDCCGRGGCSCGDCCGRGGCRCGGESGCCSDPDTCCRPGVNGCGCG